MKKIQITIKDLEKIFTGIINSKLKTTIKMDKENIQIINCIADNFFVVLSLNLEKDLKVKKIDEDTISFNEEKYEIFLNKCNKEICKRTLEIFQEEK